MAHRPPPQGTLSHVSAVWSAKTNILSDIKTDGTLLVEGECDVRRHSLGCGAKALRNGLRWTPGMGGEAWLRSSLGGGEA